ncbi:MAG: pyridoxamine 5'-phosphate oxidase family protein [Tabrizicola sp.]|uniref:pyridoxamine 5'-phosphate oxidase family protein n=1 Tax=Tabrizicola sp. TaxID=2005166 RepID=UPI002ABC3BEB|nr:pyridoxamine 5'-phosphate oxidase family protein [Tabrizicola sp.]MDZ4087742.1 pyridoxamine 5'-phosphate oxidase family protein [Tabrizicola sp.]
MALVSDHENTQNPPAIQPIEAERVWDMLQAIDIAMLVTRSSDGLRGRPMSTIPTPEKSVIYILTESDSSAARDIRVDGSVFLSYQGRGDHVALVGQATVNPDKGLVKDLWNPGAQVFWPQGPEVHNVVTLVIDPGHADVWDGPGLLRGIAEIVAGAVKGKSPDLGTRGEAEL